MFKENIFFQIPVFLFHDRRLDRKKIFWKNVRGQCPRCALRVELSVTHSSFFLSPSSFVSF